MINSKVIVIGSSAGGVTALQQLVSTIPADFQVPIFIVQHVAANSRSYLPGILSSNGPLSAIHPDDGELIQPGKIYIAKPDHHLIIEGKYILMKKGPKENRFRPSIDALFRSAAYTYGTGVIGVILTGMLDDGTSGMWSVKRMGGTTIVQDPKDAMYPSMPSSVLQYIDADYVLPLARITPMLTELTNKPMKEETLNHDQQVERMKLEIDIAAQQNAFEKGITQAGETSLLSCPDCGGVMTKIKEGRHIRFRCHTGHSFSSGALLHELTDTVEKKLWQTVRSLEETIILLDQTAGSLIQAGDQASAEEVFLKLKSATLSANALRKYIDEYLYTQDGPDSNGRSQAA